MLLSYPGELPQGRRHPLTGLRRRRQLGLFGATFPDERRRLQEDPRGTGCIVATRPLLQVLVVFVVIVSAVAVVVVISEDPRGQFVSCVIVRDGIHMVYPISDDPFLSLPPP